MTLAGESEIANLDVVNTIRAKADEDVVRFEVTMDDPKAMYVCQALQDLAEYCPDPSAKRLAVSGEDKTHSARLLSAFDAGRSQ